MSDLPVNDQFICRNSNGSPLHPFCNSCGWRKGGVDSWHGRACKCGHSEPVLRWVDVPHKPERDTAAMRAEEKP